MGSRRADVERAAHGSVFEWPSIFALIRSLDAHVNHLLLGAHHQSAWPARVRLIELAGQLARRRRMNIAPTGRP